MEPLYAALILGGLGVIFGTFLAVAARKFAVQVDERVEAVREVLPGANCGACGYAGCINYAEAVVAGEAQLNACTPGGSDVSNEIARLLGKEALETVPLVAVVFCAGNRESAPDRFRYHGAADCNLAQGHWGGFKACDYGCLGLGSCVAVCPFDAIKMGPDGLPRVNEDRCMGCGLCRESCPRGLIRIIPKEYKGHLVLCSSRDRGRKVRESCRVGCIACKACLKACPNEAIAVEDNFAVIDVEKCDNCGKCVEKCRQGGIRPRVPGAELLVGAK